MNNNIKKWGPKDFKLETTTMWSFPERGNWATHDSCWRGNWSPYIPRNIILRYSREGELILDQFAGGGTTLVEAKLLNRNIIGIDVNEKALKRCKNKTNFKIDGRCGKVYVKKGDARKLDFIPDESIDLICTHPPYANIINYSRNIVEDISLLEKNDFIKEMKKVASESYRVLKNNKFCVILMGDIRKKGKIIPLAHQIMNIFKEEKFKLKEIIIKKQHNCKRSKYWEDKSLKYNFLLIEHEYLFVFTK